MNNVLTSEMATKIIARIGCALAYRKAYVSRW